MMVRTTIQLPASPAQVWSVLLAFSEYDRWHPLLRIAGRDGVGSEIAYSRKMSLQSSRWITAQASITEQTEPTKLAWRFGSKLLFLTEESFEIVPSDRGTTLIHEVANRGLLAGITAPLGRRRAKASMDLFDGLLARRLTAKPAAKSKPSRGGVRPGRTGRRPKRR